jgi:hypothetical protein
VSACAVRFALQVGFFDQGCADLFNSATNPDRSNFACVPSPDGGWTNDSTAEFSCFTRGRDAIHYMACGGDRALHAVPYAFPETDQKNTNQKSPQILTLPPARRTRTATAAAVRTLRDRSGRCRASGAGRARARGSPVRKARTLCLASPRLS